MKPLKIGSLSIDPPVALAPMAGYTDVVFRRLCRGYGCGVVFTEVVNAAAVVRGIKPTMLLLDSVPDERPVGANIYGARPDVLAGAARIIEGLGRFDIIDINCGCPVRKIVAKGSGAALIKDPDKVLAIVREVVSATSLPVTVKTRIGFSEDKVNASELAHAAEEGGASAITMHGRFAVNRHEGKADWGLLAKVKSERSIPVVGNGGITSPALAMEMFESTGVDGIMIGRAAIGNPWIFDEIRHVMVGEPHVRHSLDEHKAVIMKHLADATGQVVREEPMRRRKTIPAEEVAVMVFRGFLAKYLSGLRGASGAMRRLNAIRTSADVERLVDEVVARSRDFEEKH